MVGLVRADGLFLLINRISLMKYRYFACSEVSFWGAALLLTMCSSSLKAQIEDENAFLQGDYVEVGISDCGCFGSTVDAPWGYNDNSDGLGFVADADRDGWDSGTPNYCGDYFVPGTPEEGFAVQFDGNNYRNFSKCFPDDIPGSITHYEKSGETVSAAWEGERDGMEIYARTSFPLDATYFITEVVLTNVDKVTKKQVYYMRNLDPDNEQVETGSYVTENEVRFQQPGEDSCKALATAKGQTYGCYVGLGTRDSRARASVGGFGNRWPSNVWNGISPRDTTSGAIISGDFAISLAFRLGDLPAGASVRIAFAYVLDEDVLEESLEATLQPTIIADGEDITASLITPGNCFGQPQQIRILNSNAAAIQWSPSLDLSTDQGDSVVVWPTAEDRAYTVSGSNACGSFSKTLTVRAFQVPDVDFSLYHDTLCSNELLTATATLDTVVDRYEWYAKGQPELLGSGRVSRFLTGSGADSIMLVAVNGTCADTALWPFVALSPTLAEFDAPETVCSRDSLILKALYTNQVASFLWDLGLDGSVESTDSVMVVDSIAANMPTDTLGIRLVQIAENGCRDTMDFAKQVMPKPLAKVTLAQGCADSLLLFSVDSVNNDWVYFWFFGENGRIRSVEEQPRMFFRKPGQVSVRFLVRNTFCVDELDTLIEIFPNPKAEFALEAVCADSLIVLEAAEDSLVEQYEWRLGQQQHIGQKWQTSLERHGSYPMRLEVATSNGCRSSLTRDLVVHGNPVANAVFSPVCADSLLHLRSDSLAQDWTYVWDFGMHGIRSGAEVSQQFAEPGIYPFRLQVRSPFCQSETDSQVVIHPNPEATIRWEAVCEDSLFTAIAQTDSLIRQYVWDAGLDGLPDGVDSVFSAFHPQAGQYGLALEVSTPFGCRDSTHTQYTIHANPDIALEAFYDFCDDQLPLSLRADTSTHLAGTRYDWGDGTTGSRYEIRPQAEPYQLTLTMTDPHCQTVFPIEVRTSRLPPARP